MEDPQRPINRAEVLPALNALADDARLRLLQLLAARGQQRGQDLLAAMGGSQPNLSRQLRQLVNAGLISERRGGDINKLYQLNPGGLSAILTKLSQLLEEQNAREAVARDASRLENEAALAAYPVMLRPFVDSQGRVAHFSTKLSEQKLVLSYVITKFVMAREYSEAEVNTLLERWLSPLQSPRIGAALYGIDAVTLRRALVEEGDLRRTNDGGRYWREA